MDNQQAEPEFSDTPVAVPKRPGIVTFAGVLLLLYSAGLVAADIFIGAQLIKQINAGVLWLTVGSIVLIRLLLTAAIGLFRLQRWARVSAIYLFGFSLLIAIPAAVLLFMLWSFCFGAILNGILCVVILLSIPVGVIIIYRFCRPDIVGAFERASLHEDHL